MVDTPNRIKIMVRVGALLSTAVVSTLRSYKQRSIPQVWHIASEAYRKYGHSRGVDVETLLHDAHGGTRIMLHWRQALEDSLTQIGVPSCYLLGMKARNSVVRSRMKATQWLLTYRDRIFELRSKVYQHISRESLRQHTQINRLAVANCLEFKVFKNAKISNDDWARIQEACISACFID